MLLSVVAVVIGVVDDGEVVGVGGICTVALLLLLVMLSLMS